MKTRGPVEAAPAKPGPVRSAPAKPEKAFGDVMRQKARDTKQDDRPPLPEGPAPMPEPRAFREPMFDPQPAAPVTRTEPVQEVRALAAELVERIETASPGEVRIQFHSNVLEGLAVTAVREGNSIEVRFDTASAEVAQLLGAHGSLLHERLEQLGYEPRVAVHRTDEPAPPRTDAGEDRERRRRQQEQDDEEPA